MIWNIKRFILLKTFIVVLLFSFVVAQRGFAEDPTPTPTPNQVSEQLENKKKEIKDLEQKVAELLSQDKTLSSQIAVMDNQIRLTQLRINATEQEIAELTADIGTTSKKIYNLEHSLSQLTTVLINRIIATYEVGSVAPLEMLISTSGVSDFFVRLNYLRIAQTHDKKMIYQTQQAKIDYANQKDIFEDKKEKVEKLKKELVAYTAQLGQEKQSKQQLLEITRNDEKRYQDLLNKARAERAAIEGVISTLQLKDGTPIKEGETIAVVGNSGAPYCSTGPHLHFEVRRNGAPEDPSGFLRSGVSFIYSYGPEHYGYYGTISPRGSWNWPLSDTVKINQGFGSHGYARSFYPTGIHSGIDMESDSSALIKAPKDGTLYKGTTSCAGAAMNYVAIDHGDNIISWYWHVR